MEPIKITDKLTLRQEALRLSVATGTSYPVSQAQQFEAYLSGDADLPERDNGMEKYLQEMKDMLFKQHNPWISADSEMKPYENDNVLVICKDYGDSPLLAEYLGEDNWDVFDADVTKNTLRGEIEVLAWMPIPPFTQPAKL